MVSSEDITIEQGGKNADEISRVIEHVKGASITHLNYSETLGKVNGRVQIIESQITNNHIHYQKESKKLADITTRIGPDRLKNLRAQNIVPLEMFEQVNMIAFHLQEMLAWKLVEFEMVFPLVEKLGEALGLVGAYEVESRVLDAVRENQNRLLKHAEDMMANKLSQQDQKIDMVQSSLHERQQMILDKQLMQFRELQRMQQEADEKKWQLVIDFVERISEASGTSRVEVNALKKSLESHDSLASKQFEQAQKAEKLPPVSSNVFQPKTYVQPVEDSVRSKIDDKLFQCPKCTARFKDDMQLEAHMDYEHGDEDDGGN